MQFYSKNYLSINCGDCLSFLGDKITTSSVFIKIIPFKKHFKFIIGSILFGWKQN